MSWISVTCRRREHSSRQNRQRCRRGTAPRRLATPRPREGRVRVETYLQKWEESGHTCLLTGGAQTVTEVGQEGRIPCIAAHAGQILQQGQASAANWVPSGPQDQFPDHEGQETPQISVRCLALLLLQHRSGFLRQPSHILRLALSRPMARVRHP
ncbi:hypothetical protein Taro_049897 [Colocasia esculenta]|uniref:Uncharacterized protein n=1 Tax=Colocasia esculenta TaxID=4460 RepID=A0A843XC11_COLES|nr:hypothetical protein [Colocasia esculenta]